MQRFLAHYVRTPLLVALIAFILVACGNNASSGPPSSTGSQSAPVTIHLGYFPNITHAVALIGIAQGTFKKALGSNVTLDTSKTFNSGPTLIEALFAGSIDIGYVGPSPAVNGYIKSKGAALRVIAGASSGGALFIVRPGANINSVQDLSGKKLATPGLGNTQDVSLRHYLLQNGLKTDDKGGTVKILPVQNNADILTQFQLGQLDGAWVPEPWASRLILEDKGKIFVDERTLWPNNQFATTLVVVSKKFEEQHPDLVSKFLEAHVDTVQYIKNNLDSAKKIVNDEQKRITSKGLSNDVLNQSFKNLDITYDPLAQSVLKAAASAYELGFVKSKPDTGLFDLAPLNKVLAAKGLQPVILS